MRLQNDEQAVFPFPPDRPVLTSSDEEMREGQLGCLRRVLKKEPFRDRLVADINGLEIHVCKKHFTPKRLFNRRKTEGPENDSFPLRLGETRGKAKRHTFHETYHRRGFGRGQDESNDPLRPVSPLRLSHHRECEVFILQTRFQSLLTPP